jgi:Raf kinase inhibitor-like YbhB/YbcL family protein
MRPTRPLFALIALAAASSASAQAPAGAAQQQPPRPPFMIQTRAFVDGGTIPLKYTQASEDREANGGLGVSPQLGWINPPQGTVSYVLNFHDMEVARNKTTEDQAHWVVWNIPGDAKELPENVPAGATIASLGGAFQISASGAQYRGPGAGAAGAPHHYMFELIALDTKLDVQPGTDAFETRKRVVDAMQGHVLGKALIVGLFKRPQT